MHAPAGPGPDSPPPSGVLGRLAALRSWASTPRRRNAAYGLAVVLFAGSTVGAWQALPADGGAIDAWLLVVAAALVVPGAFINAEEYRVSARVLGQRVTMAAGLRVAVVAAAFNLLPVPGSVLVRTNALTRGGSSTRRAVTSTAAVGLAYIGVALVLVAAVQAGAAPTSAAILGVGGLAGIVFAVMLIQRLALADTAALVRDLLVVEALSVVVKAIRLYLVVAALGYDPTAAQAVSLSMATVAASAIGVFPGGLGIREVLAGLISPAVGLSAAVGLVSTSVERAVGLATLSVMTVVVLAVTRDSEARD